MILCFLELRYICDICANMTKEESIYCKGLCAEFAVALSEVLNYKLGKVVQISYDDFSEENYETFVHAFCYHPKDKKLIIDSLGIRSLDEMLKDTYVDKKGKIKHKKTTKKELDEITMEGLYEEVVNNAKEYIISNIDKYGVLRTYDLLHGSRNNFDHFELSKKISQRGPGIFFSDKLKYAKVFGNIIYLCRVGFFNPKEYIDSLEFTIDEMRYGSVEKLYTHLKSQGHDGILIKRSKVSTGTIFEAIKFDANNIEILEKSFIK
jgi:hypothetical protein